jgi:hypothetical protein
MLTVSLWNQITTEFFGDVAAARIAATRIICRGRDCWDAIHKSESFEAWAAIGAALAIGKAHALKVTGANRARGRNYSREFGQWMKVNGFRFMRPSDRSNAIDLHENIAAVAGAYLSANVVA